jgi:hypothetical protein
MRNILIIAGVILLICWVAGLIFRVVGLAIHALLIVGLFFLILSLIRNKRRRKDIR